MDKIPSFTINHLTLMPGVYVSRRDTTPSGDAITTFDVRMTAPNREPALSPQALHAIEHLAATWLRNDPDWASRTIYWGPMGCCTGCYLVVSGHLEPADVASALIRMFGWMAEYEGPIPGATARDCGNYTFMDAGGARAAARHFLETTLSRLDSSNTVYPD